jgi:hypothetical protein
MIVHIALFAWKKDVKNEQILNVLERVKALKEKVPGVIDILCGENFSPWSENFTHAVVVLGQDRESIEAYRRHPDHAAVAHLIESMEVRSLGVDFED